MSFVNCFDVAQMVTDEASAQFAPLFCGNKEAKAILHQYCDAIDVLARDLTGSHLKQAFMMKVWKSALRSNVQTL